MINSGNPLFQLRKLLVGIQKIYSPFICQFTIGVMRLSRTISAILLFSSAGMALASDFNIPDNYTKFEYRIPMRDGVRLFTAVFVPKDHSQKYPFLMTRTPYGVAPYGPGRFPKMLGPGAKFAAEKFIFVDQDVRGRFLSEGVWKEMTPEHNVHAGPKDIDESTDTYDTIDWLLKNIPGNNGKVGLAGVSYPGFYASAGMIDAHPALVAASPQAPVSDLYMGDDAFHNGAFFLAANFSFYRIFSQQHNPTPHEEKPLFSYSDKNGYTFYLNMGSVAESNPKYFHDRNPYWTDVIDHPNYDAFWQERDILPHLRNIRPAVLVVGGWFDAEDLAGTLKTFRDIETQSPGTTETLVMGPWSHGGWLRTAGDRLGDIHFDAKTSEYFQDEIELPFFLHYLKGAADPRLFKAIVFETGKNEWHKEDQWPPANAQPIHLYFHATGAMDTSPPTDARAFDEYVSDPNKPVPFVPNASDDVPREYMDADQRFLQSRADVLTYVTKPLENDMTVVGPVSPKLFVST
ncbi:MAG TPA: CocE/NonD family hydrolase, partial [Bryobacteraceae bacterium]|nr:CocE/NonD family hydrolase [Bryobacteraceae bacterium]